MAIIVIRNRKVLLSLIENRFLQTLSPPSPLPIPTTTSTFTVEYLVNSCGLPLQSALSASKKLQLHENNLKNPQSVLGFLKAHDFNDAHIAKLIEKKPNLLLCGVEDNLKPKFEFLIANGFVGKLLPEVIVSNPVILKRALDSQIKPSLELLKSVLGSNEKIVAAIKRSSWLLTERYKKTIQPNINFLIKEGVPIINIAKMVVSQPRSIMQKHDRMVYAVNTVKHLGLQSESTMFMEAVTVMLWISESNWKKKMELMKSLGWTEEEIWSAFKRHPRFLGCSEEKIRFTMDFYINTMKLGREIITAHPILLRFAINKRIHPRYNVLKVLESKNLIDGKVKIERLLMITEKDFLNKYVIKYLDTVPDLLDIYGRTTRQES